MRRWRVEHAEYGGEDVLMNTVDFALEYRNAAGEWVQVKRIQDNHAAVTDILLDEPVTAQEWKLVIYDDGNSPWGGIRIYEWQMFETAEFPRPPPFPCILSLRSTAWELPTLSRWSMLPWAIR